MLILFVKACKRVRINSSNESKTRHTEKSHKHRRTFFNSLFTHSHFYTAADRHADAFHTDSAHQRRHCPVHPDDGGVNSVWRRDRQRGRGRGRSHGPQSAGQAARRRWVGGQSDEGPTLSCCHRFIQTYSRAGSANEPTRGRQLARCLTHLLSELWPVLPGLLMWSNPERTTTTSA